MEGRTGRQVPLFYHFIKLSEKEASLLISGDALFYAVAE
ncbi:hypothetical protein CHCC5019_4219 [Bacillus paralicheniformis]|nr:hypothetical protein CHCC5019_4219 [Bacillus paralicheniformis]